MTSNLHSCRTFEEAVETLFKVMGYKTRTPNTTLHTRPTHIHAEMNHHKGTQKLLIECKHCDHESIDLKEVEKFCHRVALARENLEADVGLLVSNTGFSEEALMWCAKNCSFVELRTYKQLIYRLVRFRKLVKKFHKQLEA